MAIPPSFYPNPTLYDRSPPPSSGGNGLLLNVEQQAPEGPTDGSSIPKSQASTRTSGEGDNKSIIRSVTWDCAPEGRSNLRFNLQHHNYLRGDFLVPERTSQQLELHIGYTSCSLKYITALLLVNDGKLFLRNNLVPMSIEFLFFYLKDKKLI